MDALPGFLSTLGCRHVTGMGWRIVTASPPQTRGFLFADLRGYSAFTERYGDLAARDLLARYRRLVRDVIGTTGGAEIRTEGDSFYVVFESVSRAVRAGLAILEAVAERPEPGGHPIVVGIGIHAGETEDSVEGIVSGAVNMAARICAQAQPGELLVSDTVRALTRTYLDVTFVPRGRRRLKGIAEPVALFSVHAHADGPTPSAAGRWRPDRRTSLAGGAAGLLAVVALVAAVVGGGLLPEEDARDAPSSASAAGISPSASTALEPTATPSAAAGPFPNQVEEALLALVEESHRPECERGLERDRPGIWFRDSVTGATGPWVNEPVPYQGSITCPLGRSIGPDTVWYWHVELATPRGFTVVPVELVRNHAGRFSVFPGGDGCQASHRALEDWSFGGTTGLLLCYTSSDVDAVLEWGYDEAESLGKAVRHDGDMAALLGWWMDNARFSP